jgi:hypothetical protein
VGATGNSLHLLDRKTFRPQASYELGKDRRIRDLALHPTRAIAFVAVGPAADSSGRGQARTQSILLVDEQDGTVHDPGSAAGSWIRIDPTGAFLFAGLRVSRDGGPDEELDPTGRPVPRFDAAEHDLLQRFRIDGLRLVLDERIEDAGAIGQGLVLSPDGQRVSYLGLTGSPTLSYNVLARDARDFRKSPITFATSAKADCKRLVYSPCGDLAAAPARGGAVVFDAATGAELAGRLPADPDLSGAVIHDLSFSADGFHLLCLASRGGSPRYLKRVTLGSP